MTRRLVFAALALAMGVAGPDLLARSGAAQGADLTGSGLGANPVRCGKPLYTTGCCFCGRRERAQGLNICTDGCPSCGGDFCFLAITDPLGPVWGPW